MHNAQRYLINFSSYQTSRRDCHTHVVNQSNNHIRHEHNNDGIWHRYNAHTAHNNTLSQNINVKSRTTTCQTCRAPFLISFRSDT
jgi:hypothetical protein